MELMTKLEGSTGCTGSRPRRPDFIVAERRLAATNARIGVAKSEYYPKLSIGALLGSATTISSGNLFTSGGSAPRG
jgi:outer membrane protein TolC